MDFERASMAVAAAHGTSRESMMVKDILEIASKVATAPATMVVRSSMELVTKQVLFPCVPHLNNEIGFHI
jgi:hypothetical protein